MSERRRVCGAGDRPTATRPRRFDPLDPWELPDDPSRRRFLALLSASAALAAGTGCSRIDRGRIVPASRTAPEAIPGIPSFYATSFQEGLESFGVLVKTREGRPILVEGNELDPVCGGKAPLRAMADVLRLYDPDRLRGPLVDGRSASWDQALARLERGLSTARSSGRPIVLLTGATPSPTRRALIEDLERALPSLEPVFWEPAASDTEQEALRTCFGSAARPRLDRARVVLSVGADPLADAAPDAVAGFAARRRPSSPDETMTRLWALEGPLTLTGAKADHRLVVKPSSAPRLLFALARRLSDLGRPLPDGFPSEALGPFPLDEVVAGLGLSAALVHALVDDLLRAPREALVLVGPALPFEAHVAGHLLNALVDAEGHTLDASLPADAPSLASLAEMRALFRRMVAGEIAGLILWGANPAYAFHDQALVRKAIEGVPFRAAVGLYHDETAALCPLVLAEDHWLESWGDFQPSADLLRLRQPALRRLYDTRQGEEVLLALLGFLGGPATSDYLGYLRRRWQREVHDGEGPVPFERFWEVAVHDGIVRRSQQIAVQPRMLRPAATAEAARRAAGPEPGEGFELVLTTGPLFDGRYANNGWLQELPDPTTKLTWGNVVTVAPADADRLGIGDGTVVRVEVGAESITAPAYVQPGQAAGLLTLALGYGRSFGSVATGVGVNAYRLSTSRGGPTILTGVSFARTGARVDLPSAQPHQRMEGRDMSEATRATSTLLAPPRSRPSPSRPPSSPRPRPPLTSGAWPSTSRPASAARLRDRLPVGEQRRGRRPGAGGAQARDALDPHRPLLRGPAATAAGAYISRCSASSATTRPARTSVPSTLPPTARKGSTRWRTTAAWAPATAQQLPLQGAALQLLRLHEHEEAARELVFNPEVTVRPRGVMEKCTFCVQRIQEAREKAQDGGAALARRRDHSGLRRRLSGRGDRVRRPERSGKQSLEGCRKSIAATCARGAWRKPGGHLPGGYFQPGPQRDTGEGQGPGRLAMTSEPLTLPEALRHPCLAVGRSPPGVSTTRCFAALDRLPPLLVSRHCLHLAR